MNIPLVEEERRNWMNSLLVEKQRKNWKNVLLVGYKAALANFQVHASIPGDNSPSVPS